MIKCAIASLGRGFPKNRYFYNQKCDFHRIRQDMKTFSPASSDVTQIDNFQYFSMKIKDLMDEEQLEYFENVIKKVENINHPLADLMK